MPVYDRQTIETIKDNLMPVFDRQINETLKDTLMSVFDRQTIERRILNERYGGEASENSAAHSRAADRRISHETGG